MKANGMARLQKFLERLRANNTSEQRRNWVEPVIKKLPQEPSQNTLITRYHTQQCINLDTVWKFVVRQVEDAITCKQVLPLIQNIIRFIYLPDTLETFFSDDLAAQHALLTLHISLQTKVRHELVAGLDELLLGCESASDFLEKEQDRSVYKVLDEIIKNVNKYERQLQNTTPLNITKGDKRSSSFSSLAAVSLKQLTYLSALVKEENEEVSGEDEITNPAQIVVHIPQPSMSRAIIAELFPEKELYQEPAWMYEGLTLSKQLIIDLKKHQDHLYNQYISTNQPYSKRVEQKLAFLDSIIYQAEHHKLTPKAFYIAWQHKPELFRATFKSKTAELWFQTKNELKEMFWLNVSKKTRIPFGYRITKVTLLQKLKTKQQDFAPVPTAIDIKALPKTSRARWYHEKRAALDYLLEKNEQGTICAEDFIYIFEHFSCLSASKFSWLKDSETETVVNNIKDFIKTLLWIDAGGEGQESQKTIRMQQQAAACLPTERRALWAGNTI